MVKIINCYCSLIKQNDTNNSIKLLCDKNKMEFYYKNIVSYKMKKDRSETTDEVVVPNNIDTPIIQKRSTPSPPPQNDATTKYN